MKVVCTHCALPFSVARAEPGAPAFCCSGCAFAFRLSSAKAETSAPAAGLVAALGVVFLVFNQALNALLYSLRPEGTGFLLGSFAAGFLAWVAVVVAQRQSRSWRISDRVVGVMVLAALVWSAANMRPWLALGCNVLLLAWSLRGLARKMFRGKR